MLVLVHGGAAAVPPKLLEAKLAELRNAAKAGFFSLIRSSVKDLNNKDEENRSALDAVQAAVQHMENSPYFNAGYGSSLTSTGEVEMDAIIADGKRLDFGALSSVTLLQNPVLVARSILEHSQHCMFTGDGAHKFAAEHGFSFCTRDSLVHQMAKDRLEEFMTFENALKGDKSTIIGHEKKENDHKECGDHDTVGSVSIDQFGNLAAATSTGGITGKLPGRVGDTPVIGSGAYADNLLGAVSTTGHGEAIMRVCLSREVLYQYQKEITTKTKLKNGNAMQVAVNRSLEMMKDRIEGYGGVIAIGANHQIGIGFTTVAMPWAYVTSDDNDCDLHDILLDQLANSTNVKKIKIHYGSFPNEHKIIEE